MDRPTANIDGCADAHSRLDRVVSGLLPTQLAEASTLPGWTIGHVLAHLVLNAQAMTQRIEAALEGELIEQYSGGAEGRAAAIEDLAGVDPEQLLALVRESAERLDSTFASLPARGWSLPVLTVRGGTHAIALLPFRRWREVEVHLVDMGVGVDHQDWSAEFVELVLPRLIDGMSGRTDQRELAAWLLGRANAPDLRPWA